MFELGGFMMKLLVWRDMFHKLWMAAKIAPRLHRKELGEEIRRARKWSLTSPTHRPTETLTADMSSRGCAEWSQLLARQLDQQLPSTVAQPPRHGRRRIRRRPPSHARAPALSRPNSRPHARMALAPQHLASVIQREPSPWLTLTHTGC